MTKKISSNKNSSSKWLDDFDELFDYHIPYFGKDIFDKMNEEIFKHTEDNKNIPPITFWASAVIEHLNSELDYEIGRMSRRIKNETSHAAKYFRSTYPKYICWMFLCRATLEKTGVSVSQVALSSGLTKNGIRSILEEAVEADYAYRFKSSGTFHYVASNASMHAYLDRLVLESSLTSPKRLRDLNTFQSFLNYMDQWEQSINEEGE